MNRWHRLRSWMVAVWVVAMLGGCAAPKAYREGNDLARNGQLNEALAKFEEASRLDPASVEYRLATMRTRERLVREQLLRAHQAREKGDLASAEAGYRQVLSMAGANEPAIGGLRAIDNRRRQDLALKEAEMAAGRKEWDTVRAAVRPVLLESPRHARALELLRQAERAAEAAVPPAAKALAAVYRTPISIEFRDATIKNVFEIIARSSGLNFVFDKEVRTDQKTSIYLKNSTVEAAVAMVLASNQLDQKVLDVNSILIYPNTAAKQREYQRLLVRSFYLANADAKTVASTLKTLLKTRDAVVDEKLNLVIVRDSPEAIRVAEKIVALHDVPEAEAMLEVEILEVKRTRLLDLGVRWPDQLTLTPLTSAAGAAGASLTLDELKGLNSGTIGVTVGAAAIIARKVDTDTNILANPRIRVRNREKAKIHIGDRVPNITTTSTATGFVSESVNYVDVGLKLDVEPTVYPDNEVAIKISLEVSSIVRQIQTKSGTLAYQIGTRTASTVLRLKDGENQVLAGLINDEDRRTAQKVPGLGEVPILGRLFGDQADDGTKTEIVLSITPRVLRNVQRLESLALEFDSGTEANAGGSSGGPVAAGPSPPGATGVRPAEPAGGGTPPASGGPGGAAQGNPAGLASSIPATTAQGAQPGSVAVRWQGPTTVRVGDPLRVRLLMQSDLPVTVLPLVVGFDPKVLQVIAVTEGDFLRQGGAATSFGSQVDPAGQVLITASRSGGGGATLEGAVAVLDFKAIAGEGGETRLLVPTIAPVGLLGRPMVGQPPAPLVLAVTP